MIDYTTIAILLAIAVAAQFVSLRFGISVAIIELLLGISSGTVSGYARPIRIGWCSWQP